MARLAVERSARGAEAYISCGRRPLGWSGESAAALCIIEDYAFECEGRLLLGVARFIQADKCLVTLHHLASDVVRLFCRISQLHETYVFSL